MDQLRYQNIAALTESIKAHHNLLKLTQLLVSVSVCSFIFFSPSSLFIFLHYFKFYFSTFPFQLFTHNIDKNSMFLLCIGLLVFVRITRSFSGSSCEDEPSKYVEDDVPFKYVEDDVPSKYVVEDGSQPQFLDVEAKELMLEKTTELDENNIAAEEAIELKYGAKEVEEKVENIILVDEEQESSQLVLEEEKKPDEENELLDSGDAIEEEEKESENDYFMIEEEEDCISTEELNKKFDDFIRRMKEDLRIEAKLQLVMV